MNYKKSTSKNTIVNMKNTIAYLLLIITFCSCKKHHKIIIECDNAGGLTTKSELLLKGLKVGQVTDLKIARNYKVLVYAEIDEEHKIPSDSKFIVESSLFGENSFNVVPGKSTTYLATSDTVIGIQKNVALDSVIINTVVKILDSIPVNEELKRLNDNMERLIVK